MKNKIVFKINGKTVITPGVVTCIEIREPKEGQKSGIEFDDSTYNAEAADEIIRHIEIAQNKEGDR